MIVLSRSHHCIRPGACAKSCFHPRACPLAQNIDLVTIAGYDTATFKPEGLDRSERNFWFMGKWTGLHFKIGLYNKS